MRSTLLNRLYSFTLALGLLVVAHFGMMTAAYSQSAFDAGADKSYEDVVIGEPLYKLSGGSYPLMFAYYDVTGCGQIQAVMNEVAKQYTAQNPWYNLTDVQLVGCGPPNAIGGGLNFEVTVLFGYKSAPQQSPTRERWGSYSAGPFCQDGQLSLNGRQCVKRIYKDNSCKAGNPVSPGSGAKFHFETDYQGAGAHPLVFSRFYVSSYKEYPAMALGWRHNWQRSIDTLNQPSTLGSTLQVRKADGTHDAYKYNGTSWQASTNGAFNLLTELKTSGVRIGWSLKIWSDDSTEEYSADGRLLKVIQRNGWTNTLTYSTSATLANIAPAFLSLPITITNHFGRKLELRYDMEGKLVKLIDPSGGEIKYEYETAYPYLLNLTKVTWQDATFKQYLYNNYAPGKLTGIIDELGLRIGTYEYDLGRVVLTQKANGAEKLTFSYGNNSTTINDITNAKTITHNFGSAQGVMRPTKISGASPLCGNTAAAITYDANGNVTQRNEHDGTITKFTYDAKNRETSRVEAVGTAAAKTYTMQWHATWNLPLLKTEPLKITAYTYDAKGNLTGQAETPTTDASGVKGTAGVRDAAKPIASQGILYNAQNLRITKNRITQIKNNLNVWVSSTESSSTSTYNSYGDLVNNIDAVNNRYTNVLKIGLDGFPSSYLLNNSKTAIVKLNSRKKIINLIIDGATINFERNINQLINRITFSNINRHFTFNYDQAGNLTQIADNWGNKLTFTLINGFKIESYSHANLANLSAFSLKNIDPDYLDLLTLSDTLNLMQTFLAFKNETTATSTTTQARINYLLESNTFEKNYYGYTQKRSRSLSLMSNAVALTGSTSYQGKSLQCHNGCEDLLRTGYDRCSRYTSRNGRSLCYEQVDAAYTQCLGGV